MQFFIGNYGPDRIVLIDPTEAQSFRLVQLPTRRVHFAVDPVRPKYAYVFTEDGKLNQVDVLKGRLPNLYASPNRTRWTDIGTMRVRVSPSRLTASILPIL
nr:hypothetical protein KXZ65_21030 [Pectobacterium sp. PL152]